MLIIMALFCVGFALVYAKLKADRAAWRDSVMQEINTLERDRIRMIESYRNYDKLYDPNAPVPAKLTAIDSRLDELKRQLGFYIYPRDEY